MNDKYLFEDYFKSDISWCKRKTWGGSYHTDDSLKELINAVNESLLEEGNVSLILDKDSDDNLKIKNGLRFSHDLDLSLPLIWGSEGNGEKIIEILETFEGKNIFNLNGETERYIYGLSNTKEILAFSEDEVSFKVRKLAMKIEDFFGI